MRKVRKVDDNENSVFKHRVSRGYLDTKQISKFERDMKHDQDVET